MPLLTITYDIPNFGVTQCKTMCNFQVWKYDALLKISQLSKRHLKCMLLVSKTGPNNSEDEVVKDANSSDA